MMATTAVIGSLSTGKRLLSSSFCPSDLSEKFYGASDHGLLQFATVPSKSIIVGKNSPKFHTRHRQAQATKALKEHADTLASSAIETRLQKPDTVQSVGCDGDYDEDLESSLEVLILLQKSVLEKQYELPFTGSPKVAVRKESFHIPEITRSGISARQRRISHKPRYLYQNSNVISPKRNKLYRGSVSPELLNTNASGYIRGSVSESLLSHAEVVSLSKKIKAGLSLEKQRLKLKEKLGLEPSDKELASALRITRTELRSKLIECSLARAKLAMSNVRLVMSIAQKYENMGAEMADLVQGGLIGLLRGIEKFDSTKGFRMSTYVYWWIRQGVSRALVGNCRTLRLPAHLHERLSSIRNAKVRLEDRGVTPSIAQLAESLNMSQKKVRNATEAVTKVISLDREAFPSLNGLPGETLHSYVADRKLENNPWHGFEEWSLKDEVSKLMYTTLNQRERDIIRLYHGIGSECHTWEDISRKFGLSRERVRQVGLVAMEKLKHAARKKKLEAMLVKQ